MSGLLTNKFYPNFNGQRQLFKAKSEFRIVKLFFFFTILDVLKDAVFPLFCVYMFLNIDVRSV